MNSSKEIRFDRMKNITKGTFLRLDCSHKSRHLCGNLKFKSFSVVIIITIEKFH